MSQESCDVEYMGKESSDLFRLYLGPLLQGQTRVAKLRSAYILLIIALIIL